MKINSENNILKLNVSDILSKDVVLDSIEGTNNQLISNYSATDENILNSADVTIKQGYSLQYDASLNDVTESENADYNILEYFDISSYTGGEILPIKISKSKSFNYDDVLVVEYDSSKYFIQENYGSAIDNTNSRCYKLDRDTKYISVSYPSNDTNTRLTVVSYPSIDYPTSFNDELCPMRETENTQDFHLFATSCNFLCEYNIEQLIGNTIEINYNNWLFTRKNIETTFTITNIPPHKYCIIFESSSSGKLSIQQSGSDTFVDHDIVVGKNIIDNIYLTNKDLYTTSISGNSDSEIKCSNVFKFVFDSANAVISNLLLTPYVNNEYEKDYIDSMCNWPLFSLWSDTNNTVYDHLNDSLSSCDLISVLPRCLYSLNGKANKLKFKHNAIWLYQNVKMLNKYEHLDYFEYNNSLSTDNIAVFSLSLNYPNADIDLSKPVASFYFKNILSLSEISNREFIYNDESTIYIGVFKSRFSDITDWSQASPKLMSVVPEYGAVVYNTKYTVIENINHKNFLYNSVTYLPELIKMFKLGDISERVSYLLDAHDPSVPTTLYVYFRSALSNNVD